LVDGPKTSIEKSDAPSSTSSDTPINKPAPTYPPSVGNGAAREPVPEPDQPKVHLPKEVLAPFHDADLLADLNNTETEQSRLLNGFFAVLGLCHTVLAAEPEKGVIEYKAQSPDEAALVQAAADVGFVFRGRDKNIMRLSTPFSDVPDEYELLQVLEFNSTRKRMSVLIRKLDDSQRIFLLCKGADNVIFERLAEGNEELKEKTDSDLQYFASEGLRTLCLAYRVVPLEEYEAWADEYHRATIALEDREDKIDAISAQIERELVLLGSTAIEDRLQDGVPETIADLKRAGIKVWVATGDKLETAVAIGYTTNLLTRDSNMIIVREGGQSVYDQLKASLEGFFGEKVIDGAVEEDAARFNGDMSGHELRRFNTGVTSLVGEANGSRPGGYSLVIDGGALRHVGVK
jgi:phospholipid-translocating ATPase